MATMEACCGPGAANIIFQRPFQKSLVRCLGWTFRTCFWMCARSWASTCFRQLSMVTRRWSFSSWPKISLTLTSLRPDWAGARDRQREAIREAMREATLCAGSECRPFGNWTASRHARASGSSWSHCSVSNPAHDLIQRAKTWVLKASFQQAKWDRGSGTTRCFRCGWVQWLDFGRHTLYTYATWTWPCGGSNSDDSAGYTPTRHKATWALSRSFWECALSCCFGEIRDKGTGMALQQETGLAVGEDPARV